MSSLVRFLFIFFAHLKTLSPHSDKMFLADVCGANIFFWFVGCLFLFLTVSLEEPEV